MSDTRYSEVLDEVKRLIEERLQDDSGGSAASVGGDSLDIDVTLGLDVYGIDSIDLTVILSHFEQEWGLTFDNDAVDPEGYSSLEALARTITRQLGD